jgi:hypothetical protein
MIPTAKAMRPVDEDFGDVVDWVCDIFSRAWIRGYKLFNGSSG